MFSFSTRSKKRRTVARPSSRSSYRPRLEALEDRCLLSSGALDPTFGSGGIVTTGLNKNTLAAAGVLLQPNGDIITYGTAIKRGGGPGLARYTPSGSLDTTFGSSGIVTTGKTASLFGAVLQSDGKIVVTDSRYMDRYNSDGSLDTSFGSKGVVQLAVGANALLIQPNNGDIVVGGAFSPNSSEMDFALARYTPNGTLDPTFGNGGKVVTFITGADNIHSLALENGDIVAGGQIEGPSSNPSEFGWALARYTPSGSLDTTFGSGGIVTTPSWYGTNGKPYPTITNLLVQPDGQIVAVGNGTTSTGNDVWALARYKSDGSLDSTFGSGGIVTSSITGQDLANGAALQPNGQIVVVGGLYSADSEITVPSSLFEVGVYNPNGSLDTSFGSGGFVTQATTYGATANGVVIQPDGKIVVAGTVALASFQAGTVVPEDFMLARYMPSAAQIGSFTASPNPVMTGSMTLSASNITLADPSSTIMQVAFYLDSNNDGSLETSGTNPDTLLGYATFSNGVWTFTFSTSAMGLTAGTYKLFAQAEDSDGVFSDPAALTLTVQ